MDEIDQASVRVVKRDARVSYRDLGREVGLSPNAAAGRLRRLLRTEALRLVAVVDPAADVRLRVLIDVRLREDQSDDAVEVALPHLPAISSLSCRRRGHRAAESRRTEGVLVLSSPSE